MAVEYHSLRELVELAEAQEKFVWEIVQQADMIESERTAEQSFAKMHEMYRAMWQERPADVRQRSALPVPWQRERWSVFRAEMPKPLCMGQLWH